MVMQPIHKECNMETFDLNRVLNREYQLALYSWDGTNAINFTLGNISFPRDLLNIPFINQKVNNFRYFRAGMRLSVRVVASKFLAGKLMVRFHPLPDQNPFFSDINSSIYHRSGDPHIIVSAAAGETGVLDATFVYPKRAYNLDVDLPNAVDIGTFSIIVMNPLISCAEDIASAKVFVTGQFIDAELFMPDSFSVESNYEQINKSKGIISSALETVDNTMALVENLPFIGSYANNFRTFTRPAVNFSNMAGFDKPTSLNVSQIMKINPFSDMANGKGIDLAPKLCLDPENHISSAPDLAGISHDEMKLTTIAGTPKLYDITALTSTSVGSLDVYNVATGDTLTADKVGFFDFIANNFDAWSGSIKVKMYFTCPIMNNAKIVFYISDDPDADWMQVYHREVDITGDTEVELTLPYPHSTYVRNTASATTWKLFYRVLAWSQSDSTLDNPIYMNTYRAAADDVRFYGHIERQYVFSTESNPRSDFAKPFQPIHESIITYIPQNVVYGEEYTNIREMLHKYLPYQSIAGNSFRQVYDYTPVGTDGYTLGIEMLCTLHAFWSGSIRHKYTRKDNAMAALILTYSASNSAPYLGTSISSTVNPIVEAEIPYFYNQSFRPTRNYLVANAPYSNFAGSASYFWKSAGDDFTLRFLCAFPPGYFRAMNTSSEGYRGLMTYLTPSES